MKIYALRPLLSCALMLPPLFFLIGNDQFGKQRRKIWKLAQRSYHTRNLFECIARKCKLAILDHQPNSFN